MIRPEPRVVKAVAQMVRQYPEILEFIQAWRMHELENLPSAVNHAAVSQGRCQVLGEIASLAEEAPALAAKL